ncbi:MAG: glucosyltransferase domain-containing protein [Thermoanaerobaculia bacterium]
MSSKSRASGLRNATVRFIGFYLLWLVPRVQPVIANVVMRDDWVHLPAGHLFSYRPLLAGDLWMWRHVFGAGYLVSVWPKLIAGMWIALTATLLACVIARMGATKAGVLLVPASFVLHPIVNELTMFNVMSGVNLALLLAIAASLVRSTSFRATVFAGCLLALALCGYQIVLFVPVVLWAASAIVTGEPIKSRDLVARGGTLVLGSALYGAYIVFSRLVLDIDAWGGRGIAAGAALSWERVAAVRHGITNAVADLIQPMLSYFVSIEFAYRAWWWVPLLLGLTIGLLHRRGGIVAASLRASLPVALPIIACGYIVVLNWVPSGWRVGGPALLAWSVALIPLFTTGNRRISKWAAILLLVWSVASGAVTLADARLRVAAQELDAAIVRDLARAVSSHGAPSPVTIELLVINRMAVGRRGILAGFSPVSISDYSNLLSPWSFPKAFLSARGVDAATSELGGDCRSLLADRRYAVRVDPVTSRPVLCLATN